MTAAAPIAGMPADYSLSMIEGQVLRTVRWSSRDERWNHPTLCQLRAFGLVKSTPIPRTRGRGPATTDRWTITDAGIAAYDAWRG